MSVPGRSRKGWLRGAALTAAVAGCWIGWEQTKPQAAPVAGQNAQMAASVLRPLLRDERLYQQARTLAALAATPREQDLARQAQRLAGEVVDASFAVAMSRAEDLKAPRADATDAARVASARSDVAGDERWIVELQRENPHGQGDPMKVSALQIAQAQLALDQARLQDAITDLARGSGDAAARIQQLRQERDANRAPVVPPTGAAEGTAPAGLAGALRQALAKRQQGQQLAAAGAAARTAAHQVETAHNRMQAQFVAAERAAALQGIGVGRLHALTLQQRQISRLDDEADAANELAETYRLWAPLAQAQERQALHSVWLDGLEILAIAGVLLALLRLWEQLLAHPGADRRRSATLRHLLGVGTELAALIAILLVIFGRPPQTLTFLGIFGAGLTLAFQDTILSLAGWFVLMSRHGVRIGDWVEINGVVGEVVEIRLLRTVLLETGNWITAGHPTGRRVFFPNNFALKGNYFNYSTGGQWMWDELVLGVPAGVNAGAAAQRVQQAMEATLQPELARAREEWEHEPGTVAAKPEPAVHLRPNGAGFDLVVRYITPARQRAETRERLWRAIAATLADPQAAAATI